MRRRKGALAYIASAVLSTAWMVYAPVSKIPSVYAGADKERCAQRYARVLKTRFPGSDGVAQVPLTGSARRVSVILRANGCIISEESSRFPGRRRIYLSVPFAEWIQTYLRVRAVKPDHASTSRLSRQGVVLTPEGWNERGCAAALDCIPLRGEARGGRAILTLEGRRTSKGQRTVRAAYRAK